MRNKSKCQVFLRIDNEINTIKSICSVHWLKSWYSSFVNMSMSYKLEFWHTTCGKPCKVILLLGLVLTCNPRTALSSRGSRKPSTLVLFQHQNRIFSVLNVIYYMLVDGKGLVFETFYKRGRFEDLPLKSQLKFY